MQVMLERLNDPKMTLTDACTKVGISPESFRDWIQRDPTALETLREYLVQAQRRQLFNIELSWNEGVNQALEDVVDPLTKPAERITGLKFIQGVKEDLEKVFHAAPGIEEEANAFLKRGPELSMVQSRMTSVEIERVGDDALDIHVRSSYADILPLREEDQQSLPNDPNDPDKLSPPPD